MRRIVSRYFSRVYSRFIRRSTRDEPDCTGRCRYREMFAWSRIAAIIESLTSAGCEVVNRSRTTPGISAMAESSAPKSFPVTGQR
jgi:hypothetical protein